MKKIIAVLGAFMLLGMAGVASATPSFNYSNVTTDVDGGLITSTPYTNVLVNFNAGWAQTLTGGGLYTGNHSGVAAAPNGPTVDGTQYLAVNGTQAFDFTLGSNYNFLGLWWGSVDGYNSIQFFNGGVATGDVVTGSQIASPANGSWTDSGTNLYVNIVGLQPFDSFTLTSTQAAFEVDNVAVGVVPEPGTMMLLGAGFLGLAIYGKRRKNA